MDEKKVEEKVEENGAPVEKEAVEQQVYNNLLSQCLYENNKCYF